MASFPGGMVQQGMQNRGMTQPQVQRPKSPGYTPQALNRPPPQGQQPMRPYDQWAAQQNNPMQPQTSQPQVMPPRPPTQPQVQNPPAQQPQVQRPLQPAGRPQGQQAQTAYDQWAARQQGQIVSADRGMGQQQPQGNPFVQNSPFGQQFGQMMNRKGGAQPSPPQSVYY